MNKEFVLKVNFSGFKNVQTSTYTMFIDTSKMSIVYEFMEWIHWLFTLDECFYLSHNDAFVNELEDIRVLAFISELKIQPCNSINCFHNKKKKILGHFTSFMEWNQIKVPKVFISKINDFNKKFNHGNFHTNPQNIINDIKFNKNVSNIQKNEDKTVNAFPKQIMTEKIEPSEKKFKADEGCQKFQEFITNNWETMNEKAAFKDIRVQKEKKLTEVSSVAETGKCEGYVSQPKTKNLINVDVKKPFSVGEILSNLKENKFFSDSHEEEENKNDGNNSLLFDNPSASQSTAMTTSNYARDVKENFKKKKRRKRNRRKQKAMNKILMTASITELDKTMKHFNVKPNHLRFSSETDQSENETDVEKTQVQEVINLIDEKKQMLTNQFNSGSYSDCENSDLKLKDLENFSFKEENYKKCLTYEQTLNIQNFSALEQLKEKFPSPIVIQRFY